MLIKIVSVKKYLSKEKRGKPGKALDQNKKIITLQF